MAYSQASNKAVQKYSKAHYEQVVIRLEKGLRDKYNEHVALTGESQAEFFRRAIAETIERDFEKMRDAMKFMQEQKEAK